MYKLYGAKADLATYATVEAAYSVAPTEGDDGKATALAHLEGLLTSVEAAVELSVAVVADAEARPLPPQPASLQELVAAGRARLAVERSRTNRDRTRDAEEHIGKLKVRLGS